MGFPPRREVRLQVRGSRRSATRTRVAIIASQYATIRPRLPEVVVVVVEAITMAMGRNISRKRARSSTIFDKGAFIYGKGD
ncbi:hypothetical protein AAJ72_01455 [Citromicrobium sp. RCC1885]|nr:hypothetical protein AAJ72_01455 [Citromicrobium sp. RCC1885]KPM27700.1 hypothetical protein AAJ74_02200 [Citromicrobium sp. RCC1878]MAO03617.1 hypothetical protein [Citromicrobium sp.]OAM10806.1 hypothetical protein A0U43_07210 [Citromicrobium sp. RCC1897]